MQYHNIADYRRIISNYTTKELENERDRLTEILNNTNIQREEICQELIRRRKLNIENPFIQEELSM